MLVFALSLLLASGEIFSAPQTSETSSCKDVKCPHATTEKHYTDSGCSKNVGTSGCCATSFNCSLVSDLATKEYTGCYYRGQKYEGDIITGDPCQMCKCRGGTKQQPACAIIDCPLELRGNRPGCSFLYSTDSCCAIDNVCSKDSNTKTSDVTCESEGKTYRQGEKMHFKDKPCRVCTCTAGFKGPDSNDGACYDEACAIDNMDEMQKGCIPVYFNDGCCPWEWHCPSGNKLVKYEERPTECSFDGKNYAVGSSLDVDNECITCRCDVPPLFTCVRKEGCYTGM